MKALPVFAAVFFLSIFVAHAQVILYEDGSQYTLLNGEKIYVSYNDLFQKQTYLNSGRLVFTPLIPNPKRDYTPDANPSDGLTPGGPEWCAVYVPYQNGYTFEDQTFQKYCTAGG